MAPMFDKLCDAQLVHRSDFQPTVFNVGSWAIKKSAFRLYWRRFLPVNLDYQMYTVFSDKERTAITAGLEDAAQGLGGCRDLIPPEGDSEAFDKGGPRGRLVRGVPGRERWFEARPDALYAYGAVFAPAYTTTERANIMWCSVVRCMRPGS